jgi:hypothetical protein
MVKKKLNINEVCDQEHINTFENADQKVKEHLALKEIVEKTTDKKAGRPTVGKSKATNKIAFVVDDEMLEYLESLTDKKDRTPNAIAKKLFIRDYEMHHNAKVNKG